MTSDPDVLDRIAASGQAVFATDAADRIVLWNKECEALFGRAAKSVLGRRCYEVVGGRDVHGNIYCHRGCPVAFQARECPGDPVKPFVLCLPGGEKQRHIEYSMFVVASYHPALSKLVHVLREVKEMQSADPPGRAEAQPSRPVWPVIAKSRVAVSLSGREREILRCLAKGMTNPAIAQQLVISAFTVRNHIANITRKLKVHTKLAAVAMAYQNNLLDAPHDHDETVGRPA